MELNTMMLQVAEKRVRECIEEWNELHPRHECPEPAVGFGLRGRTAGLYHPDEHHIRLNAALMMQNLEDFVKNTIGHEVAHAIVEKAYKGRCRTHGGEWQFTME